MFKPLGNRKFNHLTIIPTLLPCYPKLSLISKVQHMRLAETWFKLGITFFDISTNCQLFQKPMLLENSEFNYLTIFLTPFIFFMLISFPFSLYFSLNCIDQQSSTLLHFPNQIPIGCKIFFSFTEGNFKFD